MSLSGSFSSFQTEKTEPSSSHEEELLNLKESKPVDQSSSKKKRSSKSKKKKTSTGLSLGLHLERTSSRKEKSSSTMSLPDARILQQERRKSARTPSERKEDSPKTSKDHNLPRMDSISQFLADFDEIMKLDDDNYSVPESPKRQSRRHSLISSPQSTRRPLSQYIPLHLRAEQKQAPCDLASILEDFPDSEHQRTGRSMITGWE